MTDAEWAQTLEFMRSVDRHDFTFDSREGLVERFFDGDLPADEVGSVVSRALDNLEEDEWDEAAELLTDTFAEQSICATSEPDAYPQTRTNGTAHKTACHRHKN